MNVVTHASNYLPSRDAISARAVQKADEAALALMAPRLVAMGLPRWRDPRKALAIGIEAIGCCLAAPREDAVLFVAEDLTESPLGFIHVLVTRHYLTRKRCAQVASILVVNGRLASATGRALFDTAKEWACARGLPGLAVAAWWAMRLDGVDASGPRFPRPAA
jgi:hypothetical protein